MEVQNRADIAKKLRELKGTLRKEYNVKSIGYFGSFARKEGSPTRDIDILVEFSKPPGWKFFELQDFLAPHLARKVDLVSKNALKKQLRDQILKEVNYII